MVDTSFFFGCNLPTSYPLASDDVMRNVALVLAVVTASLLAGTTAFVLARTLSSGAETAALDGQRILPSTPASGSPVPPSDVTSEPEHTPVAALSECDKLEDELERLGCVWDFDAAKPRFEGPVNGFTLYRYDTDVTIGDYSACGGPENATFIDPGAANETPLAVDPQHLPEGSTEATEPPSTGTIGCGDTAVKVSREWVNVGPRRGLLQLARYYGAAEAIIDFPEDRVEACEIAAKRAVCAKPVLANGFGTSLILLREDFGVTVAFRMDLEFAELVKIVESMSQ